MSQRSVNLGQLLREAPEAASAATAQLNLKGILSEADASVAGSVAAMGDRKRLVRRAQFAIGVGIALLIAFALLDPAFVRLVTSAIPTSGQHQRGVAKPAAEHAAFSKPVEELMEYAQCLKGQLPDRSCAFLPNLSGEAAAKRLGYGRLFASAYEELALRAKLSEKSAKPDAKPTSRDDVISRLDRIVHEEQQIDRLMASQKRYAATIAYLRALQNGDVVFPGPRPLAPVPAVLLVQLMSAYPRAKFDIDDPVFAAVYRRTRDFAAARMKESGQIWAQEIIAEYRRVALESTTGQ